MTAAMRSSPGPRPATIMPATLADALHNHAAAEPRRPAFVALDPNGTPGSSLRFDEASMLTRCLSAGFGSLRFLAGGAAAVRLGNAPETPPALAALLVAGAAIAPTTSSFKDESLLRALVALSPVALIGSEDRELGWTLHDLVAVAAGLPSVRLVAATGERMPDGVTPLGALAAQPGSLQRAGSGGNGAARALLVIENGAVSGALSNAKLVRIGGQVAAEAGLGTGSRLLCPVLLTSLQGIAGALAPALASGATLILDRPFDPARFLAALDLASASHCLLPGAVASALLSEPPFEAWVRRGGTLIAWWSSPAALGRAPADGHRGVVDLVKTGATSFEATRRGAVLSRRQA